MYIISVLLFLAVLYGLIVLMLNSGSPCTGACINSECDCQLKENDIQQDKRP
jgi:hypothetical protein